MLESLLLIVFGVIIGWTFPQPTWLANLKNKLKEKL